MKKTKKIIGALVVMVCAAALILTGYYKISRKDTLQEETVKLPTTELERLEQKDLENNYPGTPSEVVKLYWRINKCMYNSSLNDKDFDSLLEKLRTLYDEEFLAEDGNSQDKMKEKLQEEIKSYKKDKKTISSFSVDKNSEVKYGEVDGRECATVYTSIFVSAKSKNTLLYEEFMCRKDDNGKWKILGWKQVEEKPE